MKLNQFLWRAAVIGPLLLAPPAAGAADDSHDYPRGSNPIYDVAAWNPGLGVPGGQLEDAGGALGGNYRSSIPIIQLPGRGLALNLQLHYNSQVWSRSSDTDHELAFNANGDWPATGWSFGYGKIAFPDALFDSDNTQHFIAWNEVGSSGGVSTMKGHLSAGSATSLTCTNCGKPNIESEAVVAYPDGRSVKYTGLGGGAYRPLMYPTMLIDANGNYISILYRRDASGRARAPMIEKIVDTVGRVVDFHYDGADHLTAISGPGQLGATRVYARFFYSANNLDVQIKLNNGQLVPAQNNYTALRAIYFPGNSTAVVLADYQPHGVPGELQQRRAVRIDAPALTEQGSIVDMGILTRALRFDFAPSTTLSAPPLYVKKTERWSDPVSGQERSATTSYDVVPDPGWRIMRVTYPDGSSSLQGATDEAGRFDRGLVSMMQIRSPQGTPLRTTAIEWERGASRVPRQRAITFFNDEIGRRTRTEFRYGQNEQQIVEELHYGFADAADVGPLLWRRKVDYLDAPAYAARNLHNLPASVTYFVGASAAPQTRIDYAYDEAAVASVAPVVNHLNEFDPVRAGVRRVCTKVEFEPGPDGHPIRRCVAFKEVPLYRPEFHGIRGNVTSTRRYADAAGGGGAVVTNFRFDSVGNLLSTSDRSGRVASQAYDAATQFSQPSSTTDGAADPASLERVGWTYKYDLSTGLLRSLTNPDGRTTDYDYVPGASAWRLSKLTRPNGAVYARSYLDDTLQMATSVAGTADGPAFTVVTAFDGKGWPRKLTHAQAEGPVRMLGLEYDIMGRLTRQSRPYLEGGAPPWTTHAYDLAGRLSTVTGPDGSAVGYFHNEMATPDSVLKGERAETVRIEDAWGRSRWINYDEQHNIRAVVEPAPAGSGSVFEAGSLVTRYYFNPLGWLKTVTQGSQLTYFSHDSFGRLVSQSLPQRQRALDAAGNYVGDGSFSDVFTYDDSFHLISATDARGVTTHYDYQNDPLGRLRKVHYAIGPAPGSRTEIAPVADISYDYVGSGDLRRVKRIVSASVASESFDYDLDGGPRAATLTLQALPENAFVTGYDFDPLGKLRTLQYPARYTGGAAGQRPSMSFSHDAQGALLGAELDGATVADSFRYHPDGSLAGLRLLIPNGPLVESYEVDQQTGILTGQKLTRDGQPLVHVRYEPRRTEGSAAFPSFLPGVTGQITAIEDLLDSARSQRFRYDALGRLSDATVGNDTGFAHWAAAMFTWQEYRYDRYGNRTSVKAFTPAPPVPLGEEGPTRIELAASERDGGGELPADAHNSHIVAPGFAYDEAGNLTGMDRGDGLWQKQVYDAAGRLARVTGDDGSLVETYLYGADRRPLGTSSDLRHWTYWIWSGNTRLSQYRHVAGAGQGGPVWSQNNFFIGARPLLTEAPSGAGSARTFRHPGRVGILAASTEGAAGSQTIAQATLPYGTESGAPPPWSDARRFTSYERAPVSGLDQAVNRNYAARLGRFLQVDPLGSMASSAADPQSLNLYAYGRNDPVNTVDPAGLLDSASPMRCALPDGALLGNGFACIGGVVTYYGPEVLVEGVQSVTGGRGMQSGTDGSHAGTGGDSDGGGSGGADPHGGDCGEQDWSAVLLGHNVEGGMSWSHGGELLTGTSVMYMTGIGAAFGTVGGIIADLATIPVKGVENMPKYITLQVWRDGFIPLFQFEFNHWIEPSFPWQAGKAGVQAGWRRMSASTQAINGGFNNLARPSMTGCGGRY